MDPEEERLTREKERKRKRRSCCFIPLPDFMQPEEAKRRAVTPRPGDVGSNARRHYSRSVRDGTQDARADSSHSRQSRSRKRSREYAAGGSAHSDLEREMIPDNRRGAAGAGSAGESSRSSEAEDDSAQGLSHMSSRPEGAVGELDLEDPCKNMDIVYRKVGLACAPGWHVIMDVMCSQLALLVMHA